MHNLTQLLIEVENHVARGGWDQPARLYALVPTLDLLRAEPALASRLGIDPAATTAEALTPVEQEPLPADRPLEDVLVSISWPERVLGCAIVLERLMLPPTAEADLPTSGDIAAWVAGHPDREEVRIAVGVLRDGSTESAVRLRSQDADTSVLSGPDLVPGLTAALTTTLSD